MIRSSKNVWFIALLTGGLLVASLLVSQHSRAQSSGKTVANEDGTYTSSMPDAKYGEGGTKEIVTFEGKVISVVEKDKDGKPLESKEYRESTKEEMAKKEAAREETAKKESSKKQAGNGAASVDPFLEEYPGREWINSRTWEYDSSGRLIKFSEYFPDYHFLVRTIDYSDKNDAKGTSKDETVSVDDAFKSHRKPADAKETSQINKDIKLDPVREYSPIKRKFHSIVDDIREEMPKEEKQKKEAPKQETPNKTNSIVNDLFPKEETSKTQGTGMPTPIPTPTGQSNLPPNNSSSKAGYRVDTRTTNGLVVAMFETPPGKIKVNLPDDMAAGDTISGTVETEPAGKNEADRGQNQTELNSDVIELEGLKTKVSDKKINWIIPVLLSSATKTIALSNRGRRVATAEVPISPTQPAKPTQFTLPTGGQQGRTIELLGNFAPTDQVSIGGAVMPEVAGSPRKKIVHNDSQTLGPTTIKAGQQECPFRNVGIKLSASKLNLQRGETVTLRVLVMGLAGISQAVLLDLVNASTNVIRMSGGDEQHVTIDPGQVQAAGTCALDRTLTANMTGAFVVTATIRWTNFCPRPVNIAGLKIIAGLVSVNQPGRTPVAPDSEVLEGVCPDANDPTSKRYGPERVIAVNNDQVLTILSPRNIGTCPIELYSVDVFGNSIPGTRVHLDPESKLEGYTAPSGAVKVVFECLKNKPNGTCKLQIDHSEKDYLPPRREEKAQCDGIEYDISSGTGGWSAGDLLSWIKNTGKCPVQIYTVDRATGKRLETQPTTIAPGDTIASYTVSNKGQNRAVEVVFKCAQTTGGTCSVEMDGKQSFPESILYAYQRLQGECDGSENIISVTNGNAITLQDLKNEGKCPIEIYGLDDAGKPVYGNDNQGQPRAHGLTLQPDETLSQFQVPAGTARVVLKCKAGGEGPCVLRILDQELSYLGQPNNPPQKSSARSIMVESCDSGPYFLSVVSASPRPIKWLTNEGSCPVNIFDVAADGKTKPGWGIRLLPGETIESYYPTAKAFTVRFKCEKITEDDNGMCKLSYENARPWLPE